MRFRIFSVTVFLFGAAAFTLALLYKRADTDREFVASTAKVTDDNFDQVVLDNEKPVVIDFYGDYCAVCRQLEPKLLTLATKYGDAAVFAGANVRDVPQVVQRYEVEQVPTLVVIHQGEVLFQGAGTSALPPLRKVLEAATQRPLP